jgi:hypothetical protein
VILTIETHKALRIARALRGIEWVLEMVVEGHLPEEEKGRDNMGIRQDQIWWLVKTLENAVKDQSPKLPPHQRPKQTQTKTVWCARKDCDRALTREQAKTGSACLVCRLEDEKTAAAK